MLRFKPKPFDKTKQYDVLVKEKDGPFVVWKKPVYGYILNRWMDMLDLRAGSDVPE